ncbi:MAG: orotate phosphoribosyltransferase [Proteobacteria bacterium]|nr:orotate phosphoribosyltransferase [Pseudomonadota bacterium]
MDALKKEMLELLARRAYQKVEGITLASGLKANYYIDCKKVSLHGPSLKLLSQMFYQTLKAEENSPTYVAGVSVGGDPLVSGIVIEASNNQQEWEALLIRKEPKKHGFTQGRAVEGSLPNAAMKIWLVEDVISTGKSSLEAADQLKKEGYPLSGVLALVDREMGGLQKIQSELSLPVRAVFRVSEILAHVKN